MNYSNASISLTRRQFLKATGATAALAALGDQIFGQPVSTLEASALTAPSAVTEDVWIKSTCHACDRNCGIQVRRVDGVVVKIEGNPDDPDNAGRICARSNGLPMYLYNPYRAKTPLKRTNPQKGPDIDPKWVEISWDEALNTVAQKLKAVKQKDPRRFVVLHGHRASDATLGKTWGRVFGTPTYNNSGFGGQTCNGCELHTVSAWVNGVFVAGPDTRYAQYVLTFGEYMCMANKGTPGDNRLMTQAKARGTKFVAVDPLLAPSARTWADEWVPIRPGTDIAFMLAMCNVLIHELHRTDEQFLKSRSNAPYLVGADGSYLRSDDQIKDPARLNQTFGKPLVWDLADNTAKRFDDATLKQPALEGSFEVKGIKAKPAFQLLKEHVANLTPEWAEKITTVPAATIRRITKEFVEAAQIGATITVEGVTMPFRPASVSSGRGPGVTSYALESGLARDIVNVLVGNINVPGGYIAGYYGPPNMTPDPVDGILQPGVGYYTAVYKPIRYPPQRADIQDIHPLAYKTHYLLWPAILNPKQYGLEYEVDAMVIHGCNPLGGAGLNTIRSAFAKVPFIFTISYNLAEPEEWADIVLPESCLLERYQGGLGAPGIWSPAGPLVGVEKTRQPVVDKPVFNTRAGDDIIIDLCDRLGILYGDKGLNKTINDRLADKYKLDLNKKYTRADIVDRELKGAHGEDHGLEWFKKNGVLIEKADVKTYYGTPKWPTTRSPIYFEYLTWAGKQLEAEFKKANVTKIGPYASIKQVLDEYHPLPIYRDDPDSDAPKEFDLTVCHYKTMLHSMAMAMDNAWIRGVAAEWNPYDMYVWMNADTAAKKGLKDGDSVILESRYGKTKGEVKTSQCVHPEAIGIGGFFGLHSASGPDFIQEGPSWNELLPLELGDGKFTNPVVGGNHMHVKVKVTKA